MRTVPHHVGRVLVGGDEVGGAVHLSGQVGVVEVRTAVEDGHLHARPGVPLRPHPQPPI
ncbi:MULTISPECIES: hypothetical protein [unclassified Streptomyces]|uniref:hypothetical protein n=1 Tax=unclassified Streptomyces TaxID=2593676 RepID=UPI001F230553|nr:MULTISPECIES: hypothetical protein [unclassified Streptomyces]